MFEMETKTCTKCGECKPLTEFHKQKDKKDGLRSHCKACVLSPEHLEKAKVRAAKRLLQNPENVRASAAIYRAKNKEKISACGKKWFAQNREKNYSTGALWRKNNPEKHKLIAAKSARKKIEELSPAYVALTLDTPVSKASPELLALKREQILNLRALKALTSTLKELNDK